MKSDPEWISEASRKNERVMKQPWWCVCITLWVACRPDMPGGNANSRRASAHTDNDADARATPVETGVPTPSGTGHADRDASDSIAPAASDANATAAAATPAIGLVGPCARLFDADGTPVPAVDGAPGTFCSGPNPVQDAIDAGVALNSSKPITGAALAFARPGEDATRNVASSSVRCSADSRETRAHRTGLAEVFSSSSTSAPRASAFAPISRSR